MGAFCRSFAYDLLSACFWNGFAVDEQWMAVVWLQGLPGSGAGKVTAGPRGHTLECSPVLFYSVPLTDGVWASGPVCLWDAPGPQPGFNMESSNREAPYLAYCLKAQTQGQTAWSPMLALPPTCRVTSSKLLFLHDFWFPPVKWR